jgi:hypothetical protein
VTAARWVAQATSSVAMRGRLATPTAGKPNQPKKENPW